MNLQSASATIIRALRSNWFFAAILALFTLQAAWLALTTIYPQAFDEQYHFGMIQLHAQQWSPFFATQPDGADQYGAIVRDPSMSYHYLLSFPYRVLSWLTDSQTIQLIVLRFTSIGILVWALVLFRRLLLMMGLGQAKAHALILFFSLLPVLPALGAQLGYDNLLIAVSALTLVWAVRLRQSYSPGHLDWLLALRLTIAMLLFSTIKLRLFTYTGWRCSVFPADFLVGRGAWRFGQLGKAIGSLNRTRQVGLPDGRGYRHLVYLVVVSVSILFDIMRPSPKCQEVLTVERCYEFGPFARDYASKNDDVHATTGQLASYPWRWAKNMMRESFFSVYSFFGSDGKPRYYGGSYVPQLLIVGWIWFWLSLASLILSAKWLWRQPTLRLVLIVSGVYAASLFLLNISEFSKTGYVAAVHGRYLFPVIVPLLGCTMLGLWRLAGRFGAISRYRRSIAVGAMLVTLLMFTQGGGIGTYILFSQDGSYWHFSEAARQINSSIRNLLQVIIVGQ